MISTTGVDGLIPKHWVTFRVYAALSKHLATTQGLKRLFKDTEWTVEHLSFVVVHKSVSVSVCHDLFSKVVINKEDRVKVITDLGRTLLDELENLFWSYWAHRLGVSDGLFQVLGHQVRVKTQEVQTYQLDSKPLNSV